MIYEIFVRVAEDICTSPERFVGERDLELVFSWLGGFAFGVSKRHSVPNGYILSGFNKFLMRQERNTLDTQTGWFMHIKVIFPEPEEALRAMPSLFKEFFASNSTKRPNGNNMYDEPEERLKLLSERIEDGCRYPGGFCFKGTFAHQCADWGGFSAGLYEEYKTGHARIFNDFQEWLVGQFSTSHDLSGCNTWGQIILTLHPNEKDAFRELPALFRQFVEQLKYAEK